MTDLPHPESQQEQKPDPPSFIERKNIHPILFAFLSLVLIFVLYQVGGGVFTFFLLGGDKISSDNVNSVRLFTMLGQVLLIFVPTLLLARLFSPRLQSVFPLRAPSWRESVLAVIGLLSLQRVCEVYMYFQDSIPIPDTIRRLIDPIRQMIEEMMRSLLQTSSFHEFLYVVVVVALIPAIVEEILFRGLVQKSFDKSMPAIASAVLTGVIFGIYHLNPFEAIPLIGIGCFLGFLRFRSASLLLPMLMHFLNNLLAVLAVTFKVGDEKIMLAPTSDQPGLPIVLAQLIVFGAIFVWSMRYYVRSTEHVVSQTH